MIHWLFTLLLQLPFLPRWFRRSLFDRLRAEVPGISFSFHLAQSEDEVRTALELLQAATLFNQAPSISCGIHKYLTLPSHTLILAKKENKVCAVLGVLIDNPLGLPSDSQREVTELRENGARVGEILGVTILSTFDYPVRISLLRELLDFAALFCCQSLKVTDLVLGVPHSQIKDYLDFTEFLEAPFEANKPVYSNRNEPLKTLTCSVREKTAPKFQSPVTSRYYTAVPTPKTTLAIQRLFVNQDPIFNHLSINDRLVLNKIFSQKSFRMLFPVQTPGLASRRQHVRYPSACPVEIVSESSIAGLVIDASYKGLSLISTHAAVKRYKMGQCVRLIVQLAPDESVELEGEVIWKSSSRSALGINLNKRLPPKWLQFIAFFDSEFDDLTYKKVG